MKGKTHLLASALLLALALPALAATPDKPSPQGIDAPQAQLWRVDGGDLRMRFNASLLDLAGVDVVLSAGVKDAANPEYAIFPVLASGGLRFNAPDGGFDRFVDGQLKLRGGFELVLADGGRIDLRDGVLRPDADNPMRLALVGSDGLAWVYLDHLMYKFVDGERGFHVRTADLRATPALAKRAGNALLVDAYIGEVHMDVRVVERSRETTARPKQAIPNFHGTAHPQGGIYEADVLMETYGMSFSRCRRSDQATNGCDGAGSDDGEVVFTPSATLRNGNTDRTADVPWYQKFTTSPYTYPYPGNDQHPYLVWNMYRIADGQLEQIGASGVKHAFLTINTGCAPGAFTGNGHILGRNCGDVYGTGNNDNVNDLGPRIELLPETGVWGRCGSIFDQNCNGQSDGSLGSCGANPAGKPCYDNRLVVRESQMLVSGAQFWSEAWYVVQDDIDIYNTMGRRTMTPAAGGGGWAVGSQSAMVRGAVINAWVDPVAQPARNIGLADDHGEVRVAVKVKTLDACPEGSGLTGTCYRYDYAVNNFDYAVSATEGALPNLRVIGAKGFDRFRIAFGQRANVHVPAAGHFADIDVDAGNDWTASTGIDHVEWTAPAGNELDWGRLFRFSLVSTSAPDDAQTVAIDLRPLNIGIAGSGLAGQIVGPAGAGESVFHDSFE